MVDTICIISNGIIYITCQNKIKIICLQNQTCVGNKNFNLSKHIKENNLIDIT